MSIKFQCEHCRKEVTAPDSAAGKRGKCPYCGETCYIPAPVSEEDILPLAPLDEEEERRREAEVKRLLERDRILLAETGGEPSTPLEAKEDLQGDDLHHFVVNYCLDLAAGKLDRAETHVKKLRQFGAPGRQAADDFASGKAIEPALDSIPGRLLQGFLLDLKQKLQS
jgi:hypothetical protein